MNGGVGREECLDLRAVLLLSMPCLSHGLVRAVAIYEMARYSVRAKVEVGVGRAHDVWVLLCPRGLACYLHDEVWIFVCLDYCEG